MPNRGENLPITLHYTDPAHLRIVYGVRVDSSTTVRVIGDPESACYEWIIDYAGHADHSDSAYGDATIALRDGLIACIGGEVVDAEKLRKSATKITDRDQLDRLAWYLQRLTLE